jgi:hypothetical protein
MKQLVMVLTLFVGLLVISHSILACDCGCPLDNETVALQKIVLKAKKMYNEKPTKENLEKLKKLTTLLNAKVTEQLLNLKPSEDSKEHK